MLKQIRHEQILALLDEKHSATVEDFCQEFNVTPMTIRRDLNELEKAGSLIRTHGGAISLTRKIALEQTTSFTLRSKIHRNAKEIIATAATTQINEDQNLFLGSGTTVNALSRHLPAFRHLTVVTDAIPLAYELSVMPNIDLVMIGGSVNRTSLSAFGTMAENMLIHFKLDAAFVGLTAIGTDGEMYLDSMTEFGIMQVIFSIVDNVYIMVDSTKIGRKDFIKAGKIIPGYTIITDAISEEQKQIFENMDVNVVVAQ